MFSCSESAQLGRINMNIFMTTIFVNITDIMILRKRYKLEEKRKKKTEMKIARKMTW